MFLHRDEADEYLTFQLPCCHPVKHWRVGRHSGMVQWPEPTSGAVRYKAAPEATALAARGPIKRTAVQERDCVSEDRQDFGGIIFQPSKPRRHVED